MTGNVATLKKLNPESLLSAHSLFAPIQSRENPITLRRHPFQEIGMALTVAEKAQRRQACVVCATRFCDESSLEFVATLAEAVFLDEDLSAKFPAVVESSRRKGSRET
jgi:hypothetical protein